MVMGNRAYGSVSKKKIGGWSQTSVRCVAGTKRTKKRRFVSFVVEILNTHTRNKKEGREFSFFLLREDEGEGK